MQVQPRHYLEGYHHRTRWRPRQHYPPGPLQKNQVGSICKVIENLHEDVQVFKAGVKKVGQLAQAAQKAQQTFYAIVSELKREHCKVSGVSSDLNRRGHVLLVIDEVASSDVQRSEILDFCPYVRSIPKSMTKSSPKFPPPSNPRHPKGASPHCQRNRSDDVMIIILFSDQYKNYFVICYRFYSNYIVFTLYLLLLCRLTIILSNFVHN